MRNATIAFFLMVVTATATPVIDPAPLFKNWPWSGTPNSNVNWQTADSNSHAIKQVWYSLQDRVNAASVYNLPDYGYYDTRSAGVMTNWSYTNWMYWDGSHPSNNVMTNYTPRLQLSISDWQANRISPWWYYYPTNPLVDYSGVASNLSYVRISVDMIESITNTLKSICESYVPASFMADHSPDSEAVSNIPHYCWAGVLIDAGYPLAVDGPLYGDYGVVTGCNAFIGGFTPEILPNYNNTNGPQVMAWFDFMAACIAQLKYVRNQGTPCSPMRYYQVERIGEQGNYEAPENDADGGVIVRIETNDADWVTIGGDPAWPYAFKETSYDDTWASSGELDLEAFHWDGRWPTAVNFEFTGHHRDWGFDGGWYAYADCLADGKVIRTNAYGTEWDVSAGLIAGTFHDGRTSSVIFSTFRLWTPGYGISGGIDSFWRQVAGKMILTTQDHHTVYVCNTVSAAGSSNYTTIAHVRQIPAHKEIATNTFILTGRYMRHTNIPDYVCFTNLEVLTNDIPVSSITNSKTVWNSWIEYTTNTGTIESAPYWQTIGISYDPPDFTQGTQVFDATNLAAGATDSKNGFRGAAWTPSIRTSFTSDMWTGLTGTARIYLKGEGVVPGGWRSEWTDPAFVSTTLWDMPTTLMDGYDFVTNTFRLVGEYSTTSGLRTNQSGTLYMLYDTMFNKAIVADYNPEGINEGKARGWWAVKDAVWILEYAFTNRF